MSAERKYRYQRVAPSLILLPGNDGTSLYAVGRYQDGPTWGLEDEPRDFVAWGWGRVDSAMRSRVDARFKAGDEDGAIALLRDLVFDNTWPRHSTMRAAIADAIATEARTR